jgi:uncharacterized membrane protein YbhN (UPF0104 family)
VVSEPRVVATSARTTTNGRVGRLVTVVVLAAMALAAYRLRGTLGEAVASLSSLPSRALLAVLGCYAAVVLARGLLQRWSLPGATLRQGVLLDQVNLAVGNSIPGGVVVGATVRYRIGRSFGRAPEAMALSVLAVGQAMSLGRWLLVGVVLLVSVAAGTASGMDVAALGSAVVAVGVGATLWWVVVRDTALTRRVVALAQSVVDRSGSRIARLRGVQVEPFVVGLRSRAAGLTRDRAGRILLAGAAVSLGGATIVATVVGALGGPDAPGYFDVVRVYLLVRVAAGFSPTPGNVGVVEGALVAGLVAAGTDPAAAVAAVMVYRGLTYAMPIATGSAAYLGWRRWQRGRTLDLPAADVVAGGVEDDRRVVGTLPGMLPGPTERTEPLAPLPVLAAVPVLSA